MVIRDTDYKPTNNVPLKSPIALGGFFLHYLRARYNEAFNPPWIWRERDEETEIFIVSGNTIETEIRNNRPAIFVAMGNSRVDNIVIGNNYRTEWLEDKKFSYGRVDTSVTINCESSNKGESHLLGWQTFTSLITAQDVLRTKYHIANIGPFDLIPPRPAKKDRETYISTINIALSYELSWNVTAIQTKLKEIDLYLDINSTNDPTQFLTRLYLNSLAETDDITASLVDGGLQD